MTPQQRAQQAYKRRLREDGMKSVTVWLPADGHARLMQIAEAHEASLSRAVEWLIAEANGE